MRIQYALFYVIILAIISACPKQKDGMIEGIVISPAGPVSIAAVQNDRTIASTTVQPQNNRFQLQLPPGIYSVKVSAESAPYPLVFPGVIVQPGLTTMLDPITLGLSPEGTAVISGRIKNANAVSEVALLSEGRERASVNTDRNGRYEFENVAAGSYTLVVESEGYATESVPITVTDRQSLSRDFRQIYVTALEGVHWEEGFIRVRGLGLPPQQAPTPTVRRELAKRAAMADAERNLLRIVEMIQIGPDRTLTSLLGEKNRTERIQGLLHGYRIVADRDLHGGRVEVELELPLTGPGGLSSYLHDL
jgi:hypothetical protein